VKHPAIAAGAVVDTYRALRRRTAQLFELLAPDAYYDRPIALRNPIVFYEGHLPAFSVNTLVKLTHGRPGIDARFEILFARGIDPETEAEAKSPTDLWPSRDAVQAYGREADALIEETLRTTAPVEATFTVLEHEAMHQETLLYMLHNLPYGKKRRVVALGGGAGDWPARAAGSAAPTQKRDPITIPAGTAILGQPNDLFCWDNEFPSLTVEVPEFNIDAHNVTNADYLEYLEATGAATPLFWARVDGEWFWRGMFELIPLPLSWPVYVTHIEAEAYARWKGRRLPTEAEVTRAAEGTPDGHRNFASFEPTAAGSYRPSKWGVHDLAGNGWEWTSSLFAPFPGFRPMLSYPEYSADFFDEAHYVMKGASPVTDELMVRPSFRNWFRPNYPYVYATFRTAH
jgi:formylglycine-generating enzyme required for sulfatase activity